MQFAYRIELDLESSPEELWPVVSDTDRLNRDAHVPAVERLGTGKNARRRLRLTRFGLPMEWEEEPFEWVSPHRFSVVRRFTKGPVESLQTTASLAARDGGGTQLVYEIEAKPRTLLGWLAIPVQIGRFSRRRFEDVFRRYDNAVQDERTPLPAPRPRLAPRAQTKITAAGERLVDQGISPELAARLAAVIAGSDDLTVSRLRPYALAETWGTGRRETLELFLQATREGILELRWELHCPLCRSTAGSVATLADVAARAYCETCQLDFTADFGLSVEVTFRPTAAIRPVESREFSVGGPQLTPHIVVQQLLPPRERRAIETELEPGTYRVRSLLAKGVQPVTVSSGGSDTGGVRVGADGWANGGLTLAEHATLTLENATAEEQLVVLERTAWSDRAATAADVTSLQLFRDLYAAEALRPGEAIPVQSLTVVFTDLRASSRYYRQVGDAAAFGRVLKHLEVLRSTIAEGDGAVVKSMGDAVMAVFPRPAAAVQAMLKAQTVVAGNPLDLKVGIDTGRCIAVSQNGVLDYFGSTVNLAARLASLSSGGNLIVTSAVLDDPDVAALKLHAQPVEDAGPLRHLEDEEPELWRLWP